MVWLGIGQMRNSTGQITVPTILKFLILQQVIVKCSYELAQAVHQEALCWILVPGDSIPIVSIDPNTPYLAVDRDDVQFCCRQMYWTDTGSVPKIERASMDGTSRIALHSTSLSTPYGLTLDIDTQTLYWMDYSRNVLEKSNADGTNRATLTNRLIADPYFLDYYDGILYWGDFAYNRLLSTPVSSPNSVAYFGSSLGSDVYGIHVITPEKQRKGQL